MFKYTPENEIKKEMLRAGSLAYVKGRAVINRIMQQNRINAYRDRVEFEKYYLGTVYFSEKKVRFVPVGSAMIDASMFDVEEI